MAELGQLTQENARIINEEVKKVPAEIRRALEEASKIALADLEKAIRDAIAKGAIEQAPADSVLNLLHDLSQQAVDSANLVNTVMLQSGQSAYLQAIGTTVQWQNQLLNSAIAQQTLNEAASAVTIGTETRRQALKKAIAQLADNGIYGFVDRAGRHWSPEAYMNMDIRTTVHNAAIQSIRARQEDYGSNIFQVSTHPGARPLCYPYQGKFYTWGAESGTFTDGAGKKHTYKPIGSTSYGQAAGLFGINCGHYPMPQIPRVTIPQDKTLENKEENDRLYQESQEQRALERSIRDAKRKQAAYAAAGLNTEADDMADAIRRQQAVMRAFVRRTGRARRYDRESIRG